MKQYISSTAGIIAVLACFLVAGLGAFNGIEPAMCCYRAVCAAIFVYIGATVALNVIARMILSAIVESHHAEQTEEENQTVAG